MTSSSALAASVARIASRHYLLFYKCNNTNCRKANNLFSIGRRRSIGRFARGQAHFYSYGNVRCWSSSPSSSQNQQQQQQQQINKKDIIITERLKDDRLYRYLQVESFQDSEIESIFDRIASHSPCTTSSQQQQEQEQQNDEQGQQKEDEKSISAANMPSLEDDFSTTTATTTSSVIIGKEEEKDENEKKDSLIVLTREKICSFLLSRIKQLEQESSSKFSNKWNDETTKQHRFEYANRDAQRFLNTFATSSDNGDERIIITKEQFKSKFIEIASSVDYKRTLPITLSMFMVGTSVGILNPVMPFVVANLGLTPGQYGSVIGAFALAKMAGNVPSAVLIERHGRKPYLVYSLCIISLGVGGIGAATTFEHLYLCRLLTGLGVAALSSASTMTIADMSTPKNRARTMAPIMSAFAAGTAVGPAIGGLLADQVGIANTFHLVGASFMSLTLLNHALLTETQQRPIQFPWQQSKSTTKLLLADSKKEKDESIPFAVLHAFQQWVPLLKEPRIRRVVTMNLFYWFSLAGAQMTLLPIKLTQPEGLALAATEVGQVYMGMSVIQVLGNPIIAQFVDRVGRVPGILVGSTLISLGMANLPMAASTAIMSMPEQPFYYSLAGVLGMWAIGSTMLSAAPVAYITNVTTDENRAQAIALLRTSGDVGFLFGASAVGAMADWTGDVDVAMQSCSGLLLSATIWFGVRKYMTSSSAPPVGGK